MHTQLQTRKPETIDGDISASELLAAKTVVNSLVVETPGDAEDYRPIVTLLEKDEHGQYVKGEKFNLNTRSGKTGEFLKNITSTHHPSTYGIQPAAFIV